MNLIRPYYEIVEQGPGIQGIYDIIEEMGKTSYKSPVKGAEVAEAFVKGRIKDGHGAVLEFGTVYLQIKIGSPMYDANYIEKHADVMFYQKNKYSVVVEKDESTLIDGISSAPITAYYITTNYRVLVESDRLDDIKKYMMERNIPTVHEKRHCIRFILDRFTGEEFLRHRVFSFCRESTRYVNYSKEKYGHNITFIIPCWIPEHTLCEGEDVEYWDGDWVDTSKMKIVCYGKKYSRVCLWLEAMEMAERQYMALTNDWSAIEDKDGKDIVDEFEKKPWTAQQARTVLPCSIKSPLAMCGFAHDFVHFFHLRALGTTGEPHPQAKELAEPLMKEFFTRGYLAPEVVYRESGKYRKAQLMNIVDDTTYEVEVYKMGDGQWYDYLNDAIYNEEELEFL